MLTSLVLLNTNSSIYRTDLKTLQEYYKRKYMAFHSLYSGFE